MYDNLTDRDLDRIIEMAWEDRTPFDAIELQFGIKEKDVIRLMRREMKESSFIRWRKRVKARPTKHAHKSQDTELRFKSRQQKQISLNRISKKKYS